MIRWTCADIDGMNSRLTAGLKSLLAAFALAAVFAGPAAAASDDHHRHAIPAPALVAPAAPNVEEVLPSVEAVDGSAGDEGDESTFEAARSSWG